MNELIKMTLQESIDIKTAMLNDNNLIQTVVSAATKIVDVIKAGGRVLVVGNGGSAGDAQHIAGEFINKFYYDRPAMSCIALTTDTSVLTAIGNDSTFDDIFLKQVVANGRKGDVLWSISTSGNSRNIVKAMQYAKSIGITNIAFVGEKNCKMDDFADFALHIPSNITPRIQESQMLLAHLICQIVESEVFPKE